MATVYVNDKPVDIGNERLNLIQVAERAGVLIPHYCWHPALSVVASCRMCLVEVGDLKDGKVTMQPKVVPGCQTPAKDGTVIVTSDYAANGDTTKTTPLVYPDKYIPGDKAKKSQADTLEGLLLNHPLDCPVCDKAGECKLQDYSFNYGRSQSRMIDDKNTPPNKPEISSKITLFTDRCIMCSRCVRFTREIAGTAELQVVSRGHHSEIDVFPGFPLENKLAGNVVDLCPVGALGSKDFLYKQRVWYLQTTTSVCAGCSTGCSIYVDANKDIVFRLRPRENPDAQGYFMCDEGRYGYHYVNSNKRISKFAMRKADGTLRNAPWSEVITGVQNALQGATNVLGVLSPYLTVEEAFLLATYLKSLPGKTQLVLGTVPLVGTDDHYPKNWKGESVQPIKFTIRAEKAPNKFGVSEVLRHFEGIVTTLTDILAAEVPQAVFVAGGYPNSDWVDPQTAKFLTAAPTLIVQDIFPTSLTPSARFVLTGTSFAEKEGTYVNQAGLAQSLKRAIKSPLEARMEGQVYLDLLGRRGLWQAASIRAEAAKTIPFFAPLAVEPFPAKGIRLNMPTPIPTAVV